MDHLQKTKKKQSFQHDMAYGDFPKYGEYQRGLVRMAYKFFDKKTSGSGIKNENIPNKEVPEELHKAIFKKNSRKKSTLTFYRQYLVSRYAINKQIQ